MEQSPIGIDLGTSTSTIAFFENDQPHVIADPQSPYKSPIIPSIVGIDRRGAVKVGDRAIVGDHVIEVKRLMGTGETVRLRGESYRPEEISAQILKYLKGMAEERLGCEIRDAIVSVPAYWTSPARSATRAAAELAGLNVTRLIKEPTAAALTFGIRNLDMEAQIVVFDFGGGTLDISVLEMVEGVLDVTVSHGDEKLGGKDFDEQLVQWLVQEFESQYPAGKRNATPKGEADLKRAAERIKIELSREQEASFHIPNLGSLAGQPVDLEGEISRSKFNELIGPLLDQARNCLRTALELAKFHPDSVDRILLVGGTTYIPAVRELVADFFGREPKAEVPPDLAVAQGAAIHAASACGLLSGKKDIILSNVCSRGLGIDVISEVGGRFAVVYSPLIQPNDKIPFSVKKEYSLLSPDQREVRFCVYEDPTGKAKFPEDAEPTGVEGNIVDIPPALYGEPHPLVVEFGYDLNEEVSIRASIPGLHRDCALRFNPSALRMSPDEIEKARQRMSSSGEHGAQLWREHSKASEFAPLIQKAEKLLASIPARERSPLIEIVSRMKDALATGSDTRIESTRKELVEALFDYDDE